MKVLFLNLSDRPDFSEISRYFLTKYCEKYNFSYIFENLILDNTRHISWSKLLLIKNYINEKNVDYIVWIDDDIIITNPKIDIRNIIEKNMKDNIIMMQKDCDENTLINAGIIIVKNCKMTISWIDKIWDIGKVLQKEFDSNWEQDAIIYDIVSTKNKYYKILDYGILQNFVRDYNIPKNNPWTTESFSAHITGMPQIKRYHYINIVISEISKYQSI